MSDNDNKNIIKILIEFLVISKVQNNTKLILKRIQSLFIVDNKLIYIRLNNLLNIKKMEQEYKFFDLVYSG